MIRGKILCNTSPIIGLMSIGRLGLLRELFDEIVLPEAVYRELCAGSAVHQKEIDESMYGKLHFGELEVIIAAKELDLQLAIIDEKAARKMAAEFLVDTIGILGILLLAKRKGLISYVKSDVDKLRMNGYRISDGLYYQILNIAGEK